MTPTARDYLAGWLCAATRSPPDADPAHAWQVGYKTGLAQRRAAESNAHVPRSWRACSECVTVISPANSSGKCRRCQWRLGKRQRRKA